MFRQLSLVLPALLASAAWAQQPTQADLIAAVPTLSTLDERADACSVELECALGGRIPLHLHVSWSKAGRYSLLLSDHRTMTPVAFFADGRFFIYDVVDQSLLVGSNVVPNLSLKAGANAIEININLRYVADGEMSPQVNIDLNSFLTSVDKDLSIRADGHETVLSHAAPSGLSELVWRFKNGPPAQLDELNTTFRSNGRQLFRVSGIRYDHAAVHYPFPRVDEFPGVVTQWRPEPSVSVVGLFTQTLNAAFWQAAIADVELRTMAKHSDEVNWARLRQNREVARKPLRRLFSGPPKQS